MGVYGEVTKFLWFLCDSVREEPDACYIMANEFSAVTIPMLMILEPGWSYQKAQVPFLHTCGSACFCLFLVLVLGSCFWRFSRCLFPFFSSARAGLLLMGARRRGAYLWPGSGVTSNVTLLRYTTYYTSSPISYWPRDGTSQIFPTIDFFKHFLRFLTLGKLSGNIHLTIRTHGSRLSFEWRAPARGFPRG